MTGNDESERAAGGVTATAVAASSGIGPAPAGSALHRKAAAGVPPPDEFAMTPARALTQALAQAGQAIRLVLEVTQLRELRMTLADLPELLEDHALLAMIEGPEGGLGLCALSPAVMSALIEVQTTGRVSRTEPPPRKPTRTDAAMCTDSIDTVLRELESALDQTADRTWCYGFRFASFLADPRPMSLLLEETRYRVFAISLGMADGARKGGIVLAFPADGRAPPPRMAPPPGQADADNAWAAGLDRALRAAPASLRAVLCNLTLPLAEVMALQPGQVLTFPAERLDQVRLAGSGGFVTTAQGRLGQFRGYRALRLTGGADPSVVSDEEGTAAEGAVSTAAPRREQGGEQDRQDRAATGPRGGSVQAGRNVHGAPDAVAGSTGTSLPPAPVPAMTMAEVAGQ